MRAVGGEARVDVTDAADTPRFGGADEMRPPRHKRETTFLVCLLLGGRHAASRELRAGC